MTFFSKIIGAFLVVNFFCVSLPSAKADLSFSGKEDFRRRAARLIQNAVSVFIAVILSKPAICARQPEGVYEYEQI